MGKLPKIVVALDIDNMDDATVCNNAKGVKTAGDADVTNPPVTDAVLKSEADDVLAIIQKRVTDQSASLTKAQGELASKVRWSYTKVGQYVGQIANDVARAQGDVDAGEKVVLRCGFKLKKKGEKAPRGFKIVKSGPGWVHLRVKAVGQRAGYAWRFGITTEKGVIPLVFLPILFTIECEVIITNLKSGSIYGYQMASILPVSHTSETGTALTSTTESSTIMSATKAKKPTFVAGVDVLNWSDFIYAGSI